MGEDRLKLQFSQERHTESAINQNTSYHQRSQKKNENENPPKSQDEYSITV